MRRERRRAALTHLLHTRQLDELLELGDTTGRGGDGGGGGHGGVDGDGVREKLEVTDGSTCHIFPRKKKSGDAIIFGSHFSLEGVGGFVDERE